MVTLRGEIELDYSETIDDLELLVKFPERIRLMEETITKLSEEIIILKDVIRTLGSEVRKGARFP